MSKLYFKIGADYDKVIRLRDEIAKLKQELLSMNQAINPQAFSRLEVQLRQTTQEFDRLVRQAAIAGAQLQTTTININHLNNGFGNLNSMLAKVGGTAVLTKLASDIVRVRGEFQQLEIAFETMLGSKEKATTLMAQLTETAAKTPFDLQSISQGAKQLLAYGTASEEVNDTLVRLGNIASGLSIPLGDMVYLYGTTQTQGRLFTQDVRQFMGRGIPLVKELAAELGKTEQEVNEMVAAGKVGFPEVERVIRNMTSEGRQFYNLMESQSASLTGQISNLGDAWDSMLNEIGTQTQGVASAGISAVSSLVENYEEVGMALASLVLGYGSYRAAIIIVNMLEKANIMLLRQAIVEKRLAAAANITLSNSMAIAAARGKMFALVQRNIISSLKGIGSTLANPYVLLGVAVGGLVYGIYKLATAETDSEEAIRTTNEALEAQKKHYDDLKSKISELSGVLTSESKSIEERFIAYRQLQRLMPSVFKNMDFETAKRLSNIDAIKLETDELIRQQRIGLKTKVVMFQQKVQGLENRIIETINRGGYTAGLTEDLNAAKKELEIYQSALKDFVDAKAESKKTQNEPVVQNKSHWGTQKKDAETAIDAIDSKQRKLLNAGKFDKVDSKVVANYKEQKRLIAEAEKELKAYPSASDTTKQENKAQKEAEKKKKEQEKRDNELLTLQKNNQKSQVDLMKESSKKKIAQIELDYKNEIAAIKKQEEEWSKAQGGKLTEKQSKEISIAYTQTEDKKDKGVSDVTKESLKAEQQALNDYLKEYGTVLHCKRLT